MGEVRGYGVEVLARNWWASAVRGLFALLFGMVAFVWPDITLTALVLLFGAYAFVDGLFAIISAVASAGPGRWWALLIEGLLGLAAGVLTFLWLEITALALLYLIAAWALVTGILEVFTAIRLRREMTGEWILALSGATSVLFGLILILFPGTGALAVTWLIGAYAFLFGLLLLALAFRLRALR